MNTKDLRRYKTLHTKKAPISLYILLLLRQRVLKLYIYILITGIYMSLFVTSLYLMHIQLPQNMLYLN
jgi:hypothetical protein